MGFFARRTEIFRSFLIPLKLAPSPRSEKQPEQNSETLAFPTPFSTPSASVHSSCESLRGSLAAERALNYIAHPGSRYAHEETSPNGATHLPTGHRSHFGSRYTLGCCDFAGLFATASLLVDAASHCALSLPDPLHAQHKPQHREKKQ